MRLEHVIRRIENQITLAGALSRAYDNLIRDGPASRQRVEVRLQNVKEQWTNFNVVHTAINVAIEELEAADYQAAREHIYFTENVFDTTQERYLDIVTQMTTLLDGLQPPRVERPPTPPPLPPTQLYQVPLSARIDLPKFDGNLLEWLSFKDMFTAMVINKTTISPVEKLQLLKTSLVGSAAQLLTNTAVVADNFQKAWDEITAFYENERLLVDTALQNLFSLKKMNNESCAEMERLYTSFMQIYRNLEMLKRPIETWDDIFVFVIVQRLDPESVKSWEHHLGSTKTPPTWAQLNAFLLTRRLSLQAFEKSQGIKTSTQPRQQMARAHFSGQSTDERRPSTCPLCRESHFITKCPEYQRKSPDKRHEFIKSKGLCFNCLGAHLLRKCQSLVRCKKCGKQHHTSLHVRNTVKKDDPSPSVPAVLVPSTEKSTNQVHHAQLGEMEKRPVILLATAQVKVKDNHGESIFVRVLLDQGAEMSLVTENLVQRLHLDRKPSSIPLIGIGSQKVNATRGSVTLRISPYFDESIEIPIKAHVLPKLTSLIPSMQSKTTHWSHISNLRLADPQFTRPGVVDILIGADLYGQFLEGSIVKGPASSPVAQLTKLGWIISGPSGLPADSESIQSYHCSIDQSLIDLLERFWLQEEVSAVRKSSPEDEACEKHYVETHNRDSTGRYIVRLPLKMSLNDLGDSRGTALKVLASLQHRFVKDPSFHVAYTSFLHEYENLQHMNRVPADEIEPPDTFYLPHHGVCRESSTTTKLRVVFNGSCRVTNGLPLNQLLHSGPKIQVDLFDVLLWFRKFKYVFSSDIEKMFRQIQVHPEDRRLQRIFWKENDEIVKFELTTVTYGLACAPFLAIRTMLQLVKDEGKRFPLAVNALTKGRYVDDVFGGADSLEETQQQALQVYQICMAGGMPLRKWCSNNSQVLCLLPSELIVNEASMLIKDTSVHTLGLTWNSQDDVFKFDPYSELPNDVTKRKVLSRVAQFFDPLGLLSPLLIRAKVFLQELWAIKLGWDDPLPAQQLQSWQCILRSLNESGSLTVPRWLGTSSSSRIELHGFCDASQTAMAATLYVRTVQADNSVVVSLLCSKTKVAPLKRMTIPRLELSAAVILAKLVSHVRTVLDYRNIACFLWTDSSIVFTWLNSHPSRWKDFVHNRVCLIQEKVPDAIWRHVAGKENPADCATRGLNSVELGNQVLWWSGPQWLTKESMQWPRFEPHSGRTGSVLEERRVSVSTVLHSKTDSSANYILSRYSSLPRLLRITALCLRVVQRMRKKYHISFNYPLTPEEIEGARTLWLKVVQVENFSHEIHSLETNTELPHSSPLVRLLPIVDEKGLLRVGGRLRNSSLPEDAKRPLIIPKDSPLTTLIIREAHIRTLHGSVQETLAYIRCRYWILGGRKPVRFYILRCVQCTRYRRQAAQQQMGQLPAANVTPSRAFLHSGVDYAGPIILKTWRAKNAKTYKAWIALFVCYSTSAIHLEIVTEYTADAFLTAYKRFTARRGICATLRSDCGTNFKGADRELKHLFEQSSSELQKLASLISNDGTKWIFNPPSAPHFGGKCEAGVKSLKYHLRRVIGDSLLTYEEMSTLLTQIEAILNSRPLCPLTDDPDDLNVLTPSHFLVGHPLTLIPEPNLKEIQMTRLSRWQKLQQMTQRFWSQWSKQYLQK